MSLAKRISENSKEIAGSRTKNRLTVQISYAMQLIIEFYSMDYIVLMDYIEDVAIIDNPNSPSSIHMYQVKTKSSDKQYSLTTVISDKWFQKLYNNALKYGCYVSDATLVCNTDIINKKETVFKNEKDKLADHLNNDGIKKIRKAIADDQGVSEEDVDLSKFYFIRSNLSTKGHKEEVEHKFEDFLVEKDPNLQVATARVLYRLIYDELDKKFNNEIDEECSDTDEIFEKKGVRSNYIENLITSSLAVQIPSLDKLLEKFEISSLSEVHNYSNKYSQIKMDMFSDKGLLSETRKRIQIIIEKEITAGVSSFAQALKSVYEECVRTECVPFVYSEKYYLKLMIMIMIYKSAYGNGVIIIEISN